MKYAPRTVTGTAPVLLLIVVSTLWSVGVGANQAHASVTTTHPAWKVLLAAPAVQQPTGIAIDLRGKPTAAKWAYVADAASRRIVKFGTNGKLLGSWLFGSATGEGTAAALAVGGSGNVFVADPAAGTVSKFTPFGKLLARWSGFSQPGSLVVDTRGRIFLAETGAHKLTELSSIGKVLQSWDTSTGFLQEYTVPHVSTQSIGAPIALAIESSDTLYMGVRCEVGTTCQVYTDYGTHSDQADGLFNLRVHGQFKGYVGDWWYGLGHAADGTPQTTPGKEAEPFVTIEGLASDRQGHGYLAGILWPLGGKLGRGVEGYGPLGSHWGYWPLPTQAPIGGIAVDGHGAIYVAQGRRILKLRP